MAECNILGAALGEIGRRAVLNFLPEAIAIPIHSAEDSTGSCEYQSWDTFEVCVGSHIPGCKEVSGAITCDLPGMTVD
jgi:hypothetical protein